MLTSSLSQGWRHPVLPARGGQWLGWSLARHLPCPANTAHSGHLPYGTFWPPLLLLLTTISTSPATPGTLATFPGSLRDSGQLPWEYWRLWDLPWLAWWVWPPFFLVLGSLANSPGTLGDSGHLSLAVLVALGSGQILIESNIDSRPPQCSPAVAGAVARARQGRGT